MFVLINIFILLMFSPYWSRFNYRSKVFLRFAFWGWVVAVFTSFYINGEDWIIYFSKFSEEDDFNLYLSFEPGFVLFFKGLLLLSFGNFGVAILCFFMLTFGVLMYALASYKIINEPLFLAALIFACGYTLILEQLRQFIACVIIFISFIEYNKGRSLSKLVVGVIIASAFHVSALVVLPSVILCNIKNRFLFIISAIITVITFFLFIFYGLPLLENIPHLDFAARKINFYMEQNPVVFQLGWLNLFALVYIVVYMFFGYHIEHDSGIRLLNRLIFVGALFFIFSGVLPFLGRLAFYFIFIATYLISDMKKSWRTNNAIAANIYFFIFLILIFCSYFRNDSAPIGFNNLNYQFLNLFDNNYLQKIANENLSIMIVE